MIRWRAWLPGALCGLALVASIGVSRDFVLGNLAGLLVAAISVPVVRWVFRGEPTDVDRGRAIERAYVVVWLRQQAQGHWSLAREASEDEQHAFEVGAMALESNAEAIEHLHHVGVRP